MEFSYMKILLMFMLKYETFVLVIFLYHIFQKIQKISAEKNSHFLKLSKKLNFIKSTQEPTFSLNWKNYMGFCLHFSFVLFKAIFFNRMKLFSLSSRKHDMHVRFCKCKMNLFLERKSFQLIACPACAFKYQQNQ